MSRRKPEQGKINVVNLSNYTSPDITINKTKEWVTYGNSNDYFKYLLDRYSGSPTNNAIINGISQMIFGKGIDATDSNKKPNEYAQAITLLKDEAIRKFCYDLKLMGQCAIQVIYSKDRKTIAAIDHIPIETLAPEKCNADGDIEAYYYFHDWANIKQNDKPTRIPSFGSSKESIEILYVKPYVAGHFYFAPVDYQGGLQYAELEEEVSNYHLNNIMNGLAPSMLINFNNGVPNEVEREGIERRILEKYSGSSNAGRFILSFNENKDAESSIEAVQLSDAHNQYQFLSDESMRKIMVSHRVVSPMLLGIKDNSGFGNNADELMTASTLMDNTVIRPFQDLLIRAFDDILAFNEISLNLYFKTLQPLEFTNIDKDLIDEETQEEETGVKMSLSSKIIDGKKGFDTKEEAVKVAKEMGCPGYHEHDLNGVIWYMPCESHDLAEQIELTDEVSNNILENLQFDELDDSWEFVDEIECDGDEYSDEVWASYLIDEKQSLSEKLAGYVTSKPNGFSYLDKSFYKIRYKYFQKRKTDGDSRDFCSTMMSRFDSKGFPAVYRLEDIDQASRTGVNSNLGHNAQPYDLFKFKGGVYCHHVWKKVLFRLKNKSNESKEFSDYKRTRSIPKSYNINPRGTAQSIIAPVDMDNNGHHPSYVKPKKKKR